MKRIRKNRGRCLAAIVLFAAAATYAQDYTVTEIHLGGSFTEARAINDGNAVTGFGATPAGLLGGFLYKNGTLTDLSGLNPTLSISQPYSINKFDQAVGVSMDSNYKFAGVQWNGATKTHLGFLPGGTYTYAYAINDNGEIAGFGGTTIPSFTIHAFRWKNGIMTDLGTLGGLRSTAWGINNKGEIVGEAEEPSGIRKPTLWKNGQVICLCNNEPDMIGGIAYAINENGQVVGNCLELHAGGVEERHAVVWQNDDMIEIGALGGIASDAWGNNNADEVVGWANTADGAQHAFFWKNGVMIDLNSCIPSNSGWVLNIAYDINNNGRIVGVGTKDGISKAFLLNPTTTAVAPAITGQPASQTVNVGQAAIFSVSASGTAPLAYQWRKNGANIAGANAASYTTPNAVASDNGSLFSVVVSNAAGSATSGNATLTVRVHPAIASQPANQTVNVGQAALFSVSATGTAPLAYQWRKNGTNITGANASSYTTPAATASDNGALFSVVVSNAAGSVTSIGATLTVRVPPLIISQPASQTVNVGQTALYSVSATGTAPLAYQWRKNGTNITGANASSYTTPAATASDNGALFSVVVSNAAGSVTSANATLFVNVPNLVPVANAGADRTVEPGTATLDGRASSDPDNGPSALAYVWSLVSGPATVGITNANSALASVNLSVLGDYVFRLTVSDGVASSSDTVTVSVIDSTPPVVNTTSVVLKGSADGTGSGIANVTVNGSPATVTGTTWQREVTLSYGNNVFTITVTDGSGQQTSQMVQVTK